MSQETCPLCGESADHGKNIVIDHKTTGGFHYLTVRFAHRFRQLTFSDQVSISDLAHAFAVLSKALADEARSINLPME